MEKIGDIISADLTSAARGHRPPRSSSLDLVALLALANRMQLRSCCTTIPDWSSRAAAKVLADCRF
jgi:hypothetical protein